jgi:mannose-6-phosphate isomerase-like protein (cupin superfamily)
MPSPIRRVVTGKDATGKAVIMIDGDAPNVRERKESGVANTLLWVTDSTPAVVTQNTDAAKRTIGVHPPPNGTVFRVVEFAPEKEVRTDYESRLRLMREMGLTPEGPAREHPRDAGMHRTRTVDYAVILSGEIDMLLDDSEVHLKAGDVVIQQGTNHAWVNRGDQPCRIAFVLVDGQD